MKIHSLKQCKRIARRHWSVRFIALSLVLSFFEAALPNAQQYLPVSINPLWISLAIGLTSAAGLACKFISQGGLDDAAD